MKISFVIPAHNEEQLISQCLRSIVRARDISAPDAEIIVVNNGSTDATAAVAAAFPGVRVISESRPGISQARQTGFLASTGELIANIDADTILPPDWIKTVQAYFSREPQIAALSGPQVYYDVSRWNGFLRRLFYYLVFVVYLWHRFVTRSGSLLQGGNYVIRRSALETIGGYNPEFKFYGEDTDMARRLHPLGPVVFTFKLPILASGRRIAAEGPLTVAARYGINYVWTNLFRKPFTRTIPQRDFSELAHETAIKKRRLSIAAIAATVVLSAFGIGAFSEYAAAYPDKLPATFSLSYLESKLPPSLKALYADLKDKDVSR